jgi:hypothetical protein
MEFEERIRDLYFGVKDGSLEFKEFLISDKAKVIQYGAGFYKTSLKFIEQSKNKSCREVILSIEETFKEYHIKIF